MLGFDFRRMEMDMSAKDVFINLVILFALCFCVYLAVPAFANKILFRLIIVRGLFWIIPISAGLIIAYLTRGTAETSTPLYCTYLILAALVALGGILTIECYRNKAICDEFSFKSRPDIVDINHTALRFTPLEVAYNFMHGGFNSGKYTVEEEMTTPLDYNGKFGYICPITPDGPVNTLVSKNEGFLIYDDSNDSADDKRLERKHEMYAIGEGMEVFDNIWYALYHHDFFSNYDDIFYLQLDQKNPDKITAVAPKIKYAYRFPFAFVPYWAGVTIVHPDGKLEDLSPKEVNAKFPGKRFFPTSLALKYVDVQIYDQGFIGGFINREGKIKIPKIEGKNKMPFFTQGADGHAYDVVLTEPSGNASALFRIYYINASTGERTFYEFKKSGILGPAKAQAAVKTLQGYKWIQDGKGDHQIIEPVYLPVGSTLYYKFTITPASGMGITATAVVNANNGVVSEFKSRAEFYAWLNNGTIPSAPAETSRIDKIIQTIRGALDELQQLKEQTISGTK